MNRNFKTVIYGDPGIGKTVLTGTILDVPEMNPVIFFDCEGNTDSIWSKCNYVDDFGPGKEEVSLEACKSGKLNCIRIKEYPTFERWLNYLETQTHSFKTLVVDSFSELDEWSLRYIVKTLPVKRFDKEVPEFPDYKKHLIGMKNAFYRMRNLDMNVIATCHAHLEDKDGVIRPHLTGQARQALPGIFKQVCLMTTRGKDRVLYFQPYGQYLAKDCSEGGVMGERVAEPTFRKLYDLYNTNG